MRPQANGAQQMQLRLGIGGDDLQEAAGAEIQPQDDVRVWLDPDGHPFYRWTRVG